MRTAVIPAGERNYLRHFWQPRNPGSKYYFYFHFAEIESKSINQTRELSIYTNGEEFYGPLSLEYLDLHTISSMRPDSGKRIEFSIEETEKSTLPPILNAFEIYEEKELSQSLTEQQDSKFFWTIYFSLSVVYVSSFYLINYNEYYSLHLYACKTYLSWCYYEYQVKIRSEERLARRSMCPQSLLVARS